MSLPTTPITDLPAGNACAFRFLRNGKGTRKLDAGAAYACPAGKTVRVSTSLHLDLVPTAQPSCDETGSLFPGPLTLNVPNGTSIYRFDQFGLFFGPFTLFAGSDALFRGRIELYDRVTIQQAPLVVAACDLKCRPEKRLEGWLVAGGVSPTTDKLTIRAVLGAHGVLPAFGQAAAALISDIVMTGVVVRG